jgi:hypothetical protein
MAALSHATSKLQFTAPNTQRRFSHTTVHGSLGVPTPLPVSTGRCSPWYTPRFLVHARSLVNLVGSNYLLAIDSTSGALAMTTDARRAIRSMRQMTICFSVNIFLWKQWRTDLFRDLQDKFGTFIDPDLLTIIRIGLYSFFSDSSPDFSERFTTNSSTSHYLPLIQQQNTIGWDHFLWGKLCKEWGLKQHAYAKRYDFLTASKQWQNALVRLLTHTAHRVWHICNGCTGMASMLRLRHRQKKSKLTVKFAAYTISGE